MATDNSSDYCDSGDFPEDYCQVRDKLFEIESGSRELAEEFLDVAQEAEEARVLVSWLEEKVWPSLSDEEKADLVAGSLDVSSARSYLNRLESAEASLREGRKTAESVFAEVGFVASGMSTSTGSTVTSFRGQIEKKCGSYNFTLPAFDRGTKQERIDQQLEQLDACDLIDHRRGAWEAFRRNAPDANAQACHSMREVLTDLLDRKAPVEAVKRAQWWEPDERARYGVSKRQKIRYFVAGHDTGQVNAEELERQVDRALGAHDDAVRIAHGGTADRESTRAALISLEDAIGTLVSQREHHRMRGSLRPGAKGVEFD